MVARGHRSSRSFRSFRSNRATSHRVSRYAIASNCIDAIGWRGALELVMAEPPPTESPGREVCDICGPRGPEMSHTSPFSSAPAQTRGPGHGSFRSFRSFRLNGATTMKWRNSRAFAVVSFLHRAAAARAYPFDPAIRQKALDDLSRRRGCPLRAVEPLPHAPLAEHAQRHRSPLLGGPLELVGLGPSEKIVFLVSGFDAVAKGVAE